MGRSMRIGGTVLLVLLCVTALAPPDHALLPRNVASTKVYCIDGPSSGTAWSWRIRGTSGDECGNTNTSGVTPSGNEAVDEQALAVRFRASINLRCQGSSPAFRANSRVLDATEVSTQCPDGWTGAFEVASVSGEGFTLGVAPANQTVTGPDCSTSNRENGNLGLAQSNQWCNFNARVGQGTTVVPALAPAGRIALAALVLAAALVLLLLRGIRRRRGAPA